MRIQVFPIDFMGQQPLLEPVNRKLHDMAVDYCKENLSDKVNLAKLNKVWVAATVDPAGNPLEITGITGWVYKVDIPVFRVTGDNAVRSTKMLEERLHAYFADQGMIGHEVFIHISSKETPEQRCPNWEESLFDASATPADRFAITVR